MCLSSPSRRVAFVLCGVLFFHATAVAGEAEQVELLEKIVSQFERLNDAAAEYAAVLEQVKDVESGDRIVPQLEPVSKAFIAEIDAILPLFEEAKKQGGKRSPNSLQYRARIQAAAQRQPVLVKEWQALSARHADEIKRIDKLPGLSSRFWETFNVQSVRLLVQMSKLLALTGDLSAKKLNQYTVDKLALYEKYGPSKVVDIGLEGGGINDRSNAEKALRETLGPTISIVGIEGDNGPLISVAPVERFSDVVKAVDIGKPIEQDEVRRRVKVQITAVAVLDLGPDWPEMDQPDESDRRWQQEIVFMTREEIVKAYGRNQIVSFEIVNVDELPMRPQVFGGARRSPQRDGVLSRTILSAAPEGERKFIRSREGRFLLGPVDDFDAFCKAIDVGDVIERDDSRRILRISADPRKYFLKAGGVTIEILNADELKKQSDEIGRQERDHFRKEFDRKVTQRQAGSPRERMERMRKEMGETRPNRLGGGLDPQQRRDDPWYNLGLLLKLAAGKPDAVSNTSYQQKGGKIEMAFVWDFDAFCKKLDFVVIVDRDNAARSLRIRADLDQLTGDAVVKRVGLDAKMPSWEQERLGLDAAGIVRGLRQKSERGGSGQNAEEDSNQPGESSSPMDADQGYQRLADLLQDRDFVKRDEAMRALLEIDPNDVTSKETRQRIARGFRELAFEQTAVSEKGDAIRGLVIWGGKYSVPLLVDLLEREKLRPPAELFDGLATLKDPRGAEAVSQQLGNFFNHGAAVEALQKMGPVAEDALIKIAPSNDRRISLAAIELLGEHGSNKSLALLSKAMKSRNPEVREAAKAADKQIRERTQNAAK